MEQNIILKMAYQAGYHGSTIRKITKIVFIISISLALIYACLYIFHFSIEIKRADTVLWKIM